MAGVLSVDHHGLLCGPLARKVYAERLKHSERNRQNRTGAGGSSGGQRTARKSLELYREYSGDFQPFSKVENGEADQGVTATTVERPSIKEKEKRKKKEESPPNPRGANAAGAQEDDGILSCDEFGLHQYPPTLVADVCADGLHLNVFRRGLLPILEARRYSDDDKVASLRSLRNRAKDLSEEELDKVVSLVLSLDVSTVKPERIAQAIERVQKEGVLVFVDPGTPDWEAWQKYFQATDVVQAKVMARRGRWQVLGARPPANDMGRTGG